MKIWDVISISVVMYILALVGVQFITRLLKLKQKQPRRIWKFELPSKQEMFYALLATIGIALYMFKAGFFD